MKTNIFSKNGADVLTAKNKDNDGADGADGVDGGDGGGDGDSGWRYTIATSAKDLIELDRNLENFDYRSEFVEWMWKHMEHIPDGKGVVLKTMDLMVASQCQMTCSWSGVNRSGESGDENRKTMFSKFSNIVKVVHKLAVKKTPTQSQPVTQSRIIYCLNNAKRRSVLKGNVPSRRTSSRRAKRKRNSSGDNAPEDSEQDEQEKGPTIRRAAQRKRNSSGDKAPEDLTAEQENEPTNEKSTQNELPPLKIQETDVPPETQQKPDVTEPNTV